MMFVKETAELKTYATARRDMADSNLDGSVCFSFFQNHLNFRKED